MGRVDRAGGIDQRSEQGAERCRPDAGVTPCTRVRLTRGRGGDAPVRGKVHADDLVLEGILGVHLGAPLGDERVAEERGRPGSHERSLGEKGWVTIESSESLVLRRGRAAVCGERVEGRAGDSPGECGERDGRAGGPSGFGGTGGWRVCRAVGSDVVSSRRLSGCELSGKNKSGSGKTRTSPKPKWRETPILLTVFCVSLLRIRSQF